RHAAARVRHDLRAHGSQSRQCADAALGRSRDRRAAGRLSAHQSVPQHHAGSVRRRTRRSDWRPRHRLCAGARRASPRHPAWLCEDIERAAQASELRAALERVGAGYGGSNRTTGDVAVVGSHDLSARTAGGTAGLDYRLAPGTVVGFALAGSGTNWSLAQGIGGGQSDAFPAGLFGTTRWGSAPLAPAPALTHPLVSHDPFALPPHPLTPR